MIWIPAPCVRPKNRMKIRISSGMARKNSTTAVAGRLSHAWSESLPAANTAPKTSERNAAIAIGA